MARERSDEKRNAILMAAVQEIAEVGLSAPTANISKRAGVATGTLFTYFATKDDLLNELYFELKNEVYSRLGTRFPQKGSLKQRAQHIWLNYLSWALEFPQRRKASVQLHVSNVITPETLARISKVKGVVDTTLAEVEERVAARGLPKGFATAAMAAMQEAAMEFMEKQPKRRWEIAEQAFQAYWRAIG
jgi:AcrR family transcriptional regulator